MCRGRGQSGAGSACLAEPVEGLSHRLPMVSSLPTACHAACGLHRSGIAAFFRFVKCGGWRFAPRLGPVSGDTPSARITAFVTARGYPTPPGAGRVHGRTWIAPTRSQTAGSSRPCRDWQSSIRTPMLVWGTAHAAATACRRRRFPATGRLPRRPTADHHRTPAPWSMYLRPSGS